VAPTVEPYVGEHVGKAKSCSVEGFLRTMDRQVGNRTPTQEGRGIAQHLARKELKEKKSLTLPAVEGDVGGGKIYR